MVRGTGDALDPKGLISEAYKIGGITAEQCRSIFLDWALSYAGDTQEALTDLLERAPETDHPMTEVLKSGLQSAARPRRRGGWRARPRA